MTPAISFMTANDVARHTGWQMRGWGHGDRTTNEHFRPLDTYGERFEELLVRVRGLGFDTVDVWGAHLSTEWATDEHVAIARELLDRHGLGVASYAAWIGSHRAAAAACRIALGLGTTLIGAGCDVLDDELVRVLRDHGVRLGVENHPEPTPAAMLARLPEAAEVGVTVDTGWWGTQGYDAVRALEELGERVFHVHLKDVLHRGEPHETCPWGAGVVPIEGCVRALQRLGYSGAITIEHEPEDHDPAEECRAMLAQLRGWVA